MIGLRVVIAGSDNKTVRNIDEMLKVLGCIVVGLAGDEISALKLIRTTEPDFVILEGGFNILEVAKNVEENRLAPLLLVTDHLGMQAIGQTVDLWGFTCLEKPVQAEQLKVNILVGLEKYRRDMDMALEAERLRSRKTTRNIVAEAREELAQKLGISEMQAFYRIQILGRERGITIRDMARKIISGNVGLLQKAN